MKGRDGQAKRRSGAAEGGLTADGRPRGAVAATAGLAAAVAAVVLAVHWPVTDARAVFLDDREYVLGNARVQHPSVEAAGLFLTEVRRPSTVRGYYQPLTMISLMVDSALGGGPEDLRPYRRTSLILHAANSALVVVFLTVLVGRVWAGALAGVLFGLHPLTVEPVAWLSDRKTVLTTFFALLALISYVGYARRPARGRYAVCAVLYVLALLSKPTSTPLPVLFLVLDFWPLRRLSWRVMLEKVPLLAIGAVSGAITTISQAGTAGVMVPGAGRRGLVPLVICHNVIFYLTKVIWPAGLSSFYPIPRPLALSHPAILAGVIGTMVLAVMLVVLLRWTRGPAAGVVFFLVGLLPTMGIVAFTNTIAADKFAYLPVVGLMVLVAAGLGEIWARAGAWRRGAMVRGVVVAAVVAVACVEGAATRRQIARWSDTEGYYRYMLSVTPWAELLHYNLADLLHRRGRPAEAAEHYRRAMALNPRFAEPCTNLGFILAAEGRFDEAIGLYRRALAIEPNLYEAHLNLGALLADLRRPEEAIGHLERALSLRPGSASARQGLAGALVQVGQGLIRQGRDEEAVALLGRSVALRPEEPDAHNLLGYALSRGGKLEEGLVHYREALRLRPDAFDVENNLGVSLVKLGRVEEAVGHFRRAVALRPERADFRANLSNALRKQASGGLGSAASAPR